MSVNLEQLLDRARNGDAEAFATVFEEYRPLMHSVAYRLVGSPDCEDVVMDAYLKTWRAIPDFRGSKVIRSWLCKVVRNCALDHLRRRKRERDRTVWEDPDAEQPISERLPDSPLYEPDRQAEMDELGVILQEALSELPEHHRIPLVLREVDGLSYKEIAATMDISIGTVMSRLFHAKRKLRAILTAEEVLT